MISDIRLQNFRSYKDSKFGFRPNINIIAGPNASGKTNLLEAILVIAKGSSYRARDQELVMLGASWARLDSHGNPETTRTTKIITKPEPSKTYEIDGKTYRRLDLKHTLPIVLFEPEDLRLLSGGPERRREYLDNLLEQTEPGYEVVRRQYKRALSQRNRLLKIQAHKDQLFPWDVRMSELAGRIVRSRTTLIERMNPDIEGFYEKLSDMRLKVRAAYQAGWSPDIYETELLKRLEKDVDLDRARGFTGAGPHREDMVVTFDGHPAQETASRGEIRTAVLALKITELRIIEAIRDKPPTILLDDVFSELDSKRRHALTNQLAQYQTFITTTDADSITGQLPQNTNIINLQTKN